MHNFLGLRQKFDNFRKGVFIDPLDEPTFLTFAIDFNFEGINVNGNMDPDSYLWESPLFKDSDQNLSNSNSAQAFLNSRGYNNHANLLKVFKEILRYLTFNAPWYFQSLNGLGNLWSNSTNTKLANKSNNAKITIGTLEAVDLRITELANLYRTAIYDKQYLRDRVPDNLRWFSMDIYLAEFRNLRFRFPGVSQGVSDLFGINSAAISSVIGSGNFFSNVLSDYGYIKFKCRQCEFDFSESLPTYTQIGAGNNVTQSTNKFSINIGYFEEEHFYSDGTKIYDNLNKNQINNPWSIRSFGNDVENTINFASRLPIIGQGIQEAGQKVKEGLNSIGGLLNPALVASANFINFGNTDGIQNLGDYYNIGYETNGDEVPPRPNPPSGNIYK